VTPYEIVFRKRNSADADWTISRVKFSSAYTMYQQTQDNYLGNNNIGAVPFKGDMGLSAIWNRQLTIDEYETLFQSTKGYYL
jgi:hypothetical protein